VPLRLERLVILDSEVFAEYSTRPDFGGPKSGDFGLQEVYYGSGVAVGTGCPKSGLSTPRLLSQR
jgi:hypothetical protein